METSKQKTLIHLIEWGLLLILGGILVLTYTYAHADFEPIPNQTGQENFGNLNHRNQTGHTFVQQLGTGHEGILTDFTVKIETWYNGGLQTYPLKIYSIDNTNSADIAYYNIFGTSTAIYNTETLECETNYRLNSGNIGTTTVYLSNTLDNASLCGTVLNTNRTYYLVFDPITGINTYFWGIDNFSYVGGTVDTVNETAIDATYFLSHGDEGIGNQTGFVSINNPTHGTTEASTTVEFSFTYNYAETEDVDIAGYDVIDIFTGQHQGGEFPIVASGNTTITEEKVLTAGNYHMWYAYLKNSTTGIKKYISKKSGFNVVTINPYFPTTPPTFDPASADATSSLVASIFGQQGYFANKFPFAYIYDVAGIMSTLSNTETENNFPTLALDLASTSLPIENLVIFSSSTISEYAGNTLVQIFRTIMQSVLWLSFMAMVFFKIKKIV